MGFLKRLNPSTNEVWKHGEHREDGSRFWAYRTTEDAEGFRHLQFYSKEVYERIAMASNKRRRERRIELRDWVANIKIKAGCGRCGYNKHPSALDFDHRDPSKKSFQIAELPTKGMMLKEMAKCDILCANCHREKTHAT